MTHLIKKFAQILFWGTFSLSLCWGGPLIKPEKIEEGKVNSDKTNAEVKKLSVMSKDISASFEVDFLKLLMEASKKLNNKPLPLLTMEGESLPKLFQKAMQIIDKVFPDCSALISLAITGFAGGIACPGVDGNAACYAVIFLNEGKVEPVFLFKAQSDCVLIKNLSESKSAANVLKPVSNNVGKNACWQMYGNANLLKALEKNLQQTFPFVYKEKNPELCFKIGLDFNRWNDIFQKIEDKEFAFVKFFWDTFIIPDIKCVEVGFDIVDKTLEAKTFVYSQEYSPLSAYVKSLEAKSKEIRFLNWSSREVIQELSFQNYSGLKNYVESLDSRIKYNQNATDFCSLFKNLWATICPLLKDILAFCDENFTGNTQSYADLQGTDKMISSKGFGFFEGKQLKRENVLNFVDNLAGKLKVSLKEMIEKKNFGWEICKDISLNVKKAVGKHHDCDIDQIFWKGEGNNAHCPIWFAVYKNYLLYADDIGNLKRLIERMEEMKVPSYQKQNGYCYSRMKMNFASVMHTLEVLEFKSIPELSMEIDSGLNAGVCVSTIKIPGFLDVFSLKTILPSDNESAKKEGSNHSNSSTAPMVK